MATAPTLELSAHTIALDEPSSRRAAAAATVIFSPVVAVGLWQAASSTGILPASKLASPASIAHTAYTLVVTNSPAYGTLQESLLVSCERWAVGLAIGITLVVIHIFGIHITGVSVNPARSLGPALLVGGQALEQVWLFLLIPSIAGIVAGLFFRTKVLEAD